MKREQVPVGNAAAVPGSYGWPVLGWLYDTADFFLLRGWKQFFLSRQRKYGSRVFRCHFLMKTIAVLDHEGFEPLFNWDGRLRKENGFGWAKAPPALVGNTMPSIFAEGQPHEGPKSFYMELMRARAPKLGPVFSTVAAEYFGRWEQGKPFGWRDEIERFYASFFFEWLLGLRPDPEDVRLLYNNLFGHIFWRITQFLPWSRHSRSVAAFERLLSQIKGSKQFVGVKNPDEAAKQLLFMIGVNCYLGLQSLTRSAVGELSRLPPEQCTALRAEVDARLDGPLLDNFLNEVLRLHPPVFFIFGRAARDFVLQTASGQYAIPAGEMLMGVIPLAQRNPGIHDAPDDFRLDRFEDASVAGTMVWPHGTLAEPISARSRICPGRHLGVMITKFFCAKLLRTYEWKLRKPVSWDERLFTLNVAAPRGRLKVSRFARLNSASQAAKSRTNRTFGPWRLRFIRMPVIAWLLQAIPSVRRFVNRYSVNFLVTRTRHRPYPYSLWTPHAKPPAPDSKREEPYVSWTGLFDRCYTGRHLEPDGARPLPALKDVRRLFERPAMTSCATSSALFSFFAQWFTDSFLRTDPYDSRRTTSNHEIDLCQIYGLDAATTALLRENDGSGKLRTKDGGLFPALLFDQNGQPQPHFSELPYVQKHKSDPQGRLIIDVVLDRLRGEIPAVELAERRKRLYASGLERGNSSILYSALSTVFLREHNRICDELRRHHGWKDDHRLFETARNINIVLLLRLIVEEYINHIANERFKFQFDNTFAQKQLWYRTNRIMVEFNLLYRWHSLVPDTLLLRGETLQPADFMVNNERLERAGVETVIAAASRQPAGRIGLQNTPRFLVDAEERALEFARCHRVQPYNKYCIRFRVPPARSFDELTGDPDLARELERLYGHVDNVELPVGLYAERHSSMLGDLMRAMVAVDAFSHALTNPLLADEIYGERAFGKKGMEIIKETSCLADVVKRNAPRDARDDVVCRFAL
jgi:cytochrome P450